MYKVYANAHYGKEYGKLKMDELNEYLKNCYPNNYISGYQDCNLLLWGKDGTIPKLFSLIIGIEYEPYVGMRGGKSISDVLSSKYRTDISFNRLMKYGERIAKLSNRPFITLVYLVLSLPLSALFLSVH